MKKVKLVLMIWLAGFTAFSQSITVESDENLRADFSDIKTFGFTSQVDDRLDPGLYFLNDLAFKSEIRQAVESELMGLGYTKATSEPDMIVNFRVFQEPVTIKGFEGLGTTYWTGSTVRDPDSATEYDLKAGTLMVHLVNRKTGELVWQGFASGLIDNDKFIKDQVKVREAVSMIFDQFGERATEYTRK